VEGAAPWLTELLAGDPDKAVLAGLEQHPLEAHAGPLLSLGAFGDHRPSRAQALGQPVAHEFELAEVEQARSACARGGHGLQATHGDGGHKRIGQLTLELDDLCSQRPSRGTLNVFFDERPRKKLCRFGAAVYE
jgi:hypothetical protein